MSTPSLAETTLVVVLGAERFPDAGLTESAAFRLAADSVAIYFLLDDGFRLPIENLFYFFDAELDPSSLDRILARRLRSRLQQLDAKATPATDIVVYYVGHGLFDERRRYCLALRTTRCENIGVSSLAVQSLMVTIDNVAARLRKYVILDACYSGEGALYSQSETNERAAQQIRTIPSKGTAFLCSSSRDQVSEFLPDHSNTVFTRALGTVLRRGSDQHGDLLSLEDLYSLMEESLWTPDGFYIHPELHRPVQSDGDVAKVRLFPNGPERAADAAADAARAKRVDDLRTYLEEQRNEQAKLAADAREQQARSEEETRAKVLAEREAEARARERRSKRYGSEHERRFREEAETAAPGELDRALLVDWLNWEAERLRAQAALHDREAKQFRIIANERLEHSRNAAESAEIASKTGSSEMVNRGYANSARLERVAREHEQAAVRESDLAEEDRLLAAVHERRASDLAQVDTDAQRAIGSRRSFQAVVAEAIAPKLQEHRRRRDLRRAKEAIWTWTVRVFWIGLIVCAVATCTYAGSTG